MRGMTEGAGQRRLQGAKSQGLREHSLPLLSALTCYNNAYTASLFPRPFPAQK